MAATIQDPAALTTNATQYILSKFYDKVYIKRLLPELRWFSATEKRRLPMHGGKVIKFSAFKKLTVGTRLGEGVKPTPKNLSTFNVTATLGQWGDYSAVSDLLEVTGITSTITEAVAIMGEHSALTIDTQIRNAAWGGGLPSAISRLSASLRIRNTGSVSLLSALNGLVGGFTIRLTRQCSGFTLQNLSTHSTLAASSFTAATQVTLKDIRETVKVLQARDVKPFHADGMYFGIAHPSLLSDLRNDTTSTGWAEWQKYTSPESMFKGEVGRAEGVRWVASTNAIDLPTNTGSQASASIMTIMGKQALGSVDFENTLDGKGVNHIIVKKASQYNTDDPLNQIAGTVGWKSTFAAVVLNVSSGMHLLAVRN